MPDKKQRFQVLHPQAFFLTADAPELLSTFLKEIGWLAADETLRAIEKPGEGNMNYVLRVRTDRRSFIVKQARPWVEKYPQLDAPIERIAVEATFYKVLSQVPAVSTCIPELLGFAPAHFLMALEDVGEASDYTTIYQKSEDLSDAELEDIVHFLTELHHIPTGEMRASFPANQVLKVLNAEHIFTYPYLEENGLDLDTIQPGLQTLATTYRTDEVLKARVAQLKEVYLGQGEVLLHGDYYPGSWLRTERGLRIIDPEFAYLGSPEFDLGVLVAHLKMAQVPDDRIARALVPYQTKGKVPDHALFAGFCGAEILRRILGLAQLPLDLTLEEKKHLLLWAAASVLNPEMNTFI